MSFLLNSREERKNTKDECGQDPYLSLFMWLGLPSSMAAGSENKDTKRQPGRDDIAFYGLILEGMEGHAFTFRSLD